MFFSIPFSGFPFEVVRVRRGSLAEFYLEKLRYMVIARCEAKDAGQLDSTKLRMLHLNLS